MWFSVRQHSTMPRLLAASGSLPLPEWVTNVISLMHGCVCVCMYVCVFVCVCVCVWVCAIVNRKCIHVHLWWRLIDLPGDLIQSRKRLSCVSMVYCALHLYLCRLLGKIIGDLEDMNAGTPEMWKNHSKDVITMLTLAGNSFYRQSLQVQRNRKCILHTVDIV